MFQFFRKRDWQAASFDEISGSYKGLRVVLRNFPYRQDALSSSRRFAYRDFGVGFLEKLHEELGSHDEVMRKASLGIANKANIHLKALPAIEVEIIGKLPTSKKEYYSDLADALINAFDQQGVKP